MPLSARSCFGAPRALAAAFTLAFFLLAVAPLPLLAADPAGASSAPPCRFGDVVTERAAYDDWAITIVDTELRLPPGYTPPDLVSVSRAGLAGSGRVRALVVDDLAAMASAAEAAGAPLAVISAYRSEGQQRTVFAGWVRQVGDAAARLASARPGHSEHQLGTTIDFTTPDLTGPWANDFGASPQGAWLHRHAAEFGFVESYPAASSPKATCYQAEPWHYRYVGRDEAARVVAAKQPLRRYLFAHAPGAAPATASDGGGTTSGSGPASTAAEGSPAAAGSTSAAASSGGQAARPAPPLTDASPATSPDAHVRRAIDDGVAPVFIAGLAVGFGIDWLRVLVRSRRRRAAQRSTWAGRAGRRG